MSWGMPPPEAADDAPQPPEIEGEPGEPAVPGCPYCGAPMPCVPHRPGG